MPWAASAGRRAAADAYVTFTSPIQIPLMSARDAWQWELVESPVGRAALLPVTLPIQLLKHTGLTALHLLDLVAFPLHLFDEEEAPQVYDRDQFPMVMVQDSGEEIGDLALWGVAIPGGTAVIYYMVTVLVPALFSLF